MSTFDFEDLVDEFANCGGDSGNPPLPIARDGGTTFVDGEGTPVGWTAGTVDPAFVVPFKARELEALPEGIRERGAIKVFTRERLFGVRWGSEPTSRRGDVVEWEGACWQITEVSDWYAAAGLQEHCAVRMDRPASSVAAFILEEAA